MRAQLQSLLLAALVSCGAAALAGYEEGFKAHERGDHATALRELSPGAAAGDARSQRGLAWLYEQGLGVPQDHTQALAWYSKAAAQGDGFSMYRIGGLYQDGLGVAKDIPRALEWYRKAATAGWADAQSQLGWLYLQGEVVPRDIRQGTDWTRKAAAQGNASAENNLGWIYRDGVGVPADNALAAQWFRKAAEQGNAVAQRNLGLMLMSGRGVVADAAQAALWMRKAADQGDAEAQKTLASMRGGSAAASEARASQVPPSGSLSLLCQLQTGHSYVFVIDERAQQVAVRDSASQDWITFKTGQVTRQRMGDQALPMIDSVRVDATAIRVLREMRDEPVGTQPNVSRNPQTNELAGLLGGLIGAIATTSSVMIDRNSGTIRTGGMGLFPNNGAGSCEPWTGRRF